ncbi:DNA-3-methyladenine glycosylase [Apibacter sp. B2912]|uniref:DNA-3-methyladenine glycosylase n=1 Tax=Apibacter sp. B2912 TaxID=2656763 RepID=UPI00136CC957|nr:DNA-3-methyladenine glycosylase [Apibacter sp. B2912]MXO31551.1 DNA-3-methyladenine glycosylase [Apibacter sp. B2912]
MRIDTKFFQKEAFFVAQELLGKKIVRVYDSGEIVKYTITETEAYGGEEDLACHASKGRTKRTEIMYHEGGKVYVYLIYGIYWMLNFVTGKKNQPQAVLIRGVEECSGPGRIGKLLQLNKDFYGEDLASSKKIWVEDSQIKPNFITTVRVGIDYAGEIWKNKLWRFIITRN